MSREKLIGGALVALTGAGVLAAVGPASGHAWGRANACVSINGHSVSTPFSPSGGNATCHSISVGDIAVAVSKSGQTTSAGAAGGTAVAVGNTSADATNGGIGVSTRKCQTFGAFAAGDIQHCP